MTCSGGVSAGLLGELIIVLKLVNQRVRRPVRSVRRRVHEAHTAADDSSGDLVWMVAEMPGVLDPLSALGGAFGGAEAVADHGQFVLKPTGVVPPDFRRVGSPVALPVRGIAENAFDLDPAVIADGGGPLGVEYISHVSGIRRCGFTRGYDISASRAKWRKRRERHMVQRDASRLRAWPLAQMGRRLGRRATVFGAA